jgi:lipopolysaccharide export system permease protein
VKKLHRMILLSMPGPFVAALGTLVFILLLQFLIMNLHHLVGRGLPMGAILELITYSLAYMVTLAVPMSVMLTTLMVFGRFAESEAYAVAKSSGISLLRLTWPALMVGVFVVAGMTYFNNVMLPEANHRMRGLWQDIRMAKPGFELEAGVFYDGLDGYTIRVMETEAESNVLRGVLIFDHTGGGEATIVAEEGELRALAGGRKLEMLLRAGEIHRSSHVRGEGGRTTRYERIAFDQHRLSLDLSDLTFERTDADDASRTTRTMRSSQLAVLIDSLETSGAQRRTHIRQRIDHLLRPPEPVEDADTWIDVSGPDTLAALVEGHPLLTALPVSERSQVTDMGVQRARSARAEVDAAASTIRWEQLRADRFRIEIYKKYSMAVACFVFVLVGIPLGLAVRRRGYGWSIVLAVGVFLFYWITLVQGEKLGTRGHIPPWIGMWAANVIVGFGAIYLFARETREPAPTGSLLLRRRRATPGTTAEGAEPSARASTTGEPVHAEAGPRRLA